MTTTADTSARRVRAALYVRISRDRIGAGLGVERQQKDCRELADRLGWEVVAVFVDNDISASGGKKYRPDYQRMLGEIRAGSVDAVVSWHSDRVHRSSRELLEYIDVCQPRDVATHCVKAGVLDLSTANGRMIAKVSAAIAEGETEHMSERIRAQKAAKRQAGEWRGGGRPFGYERGGRALRDTEADLIRDAVRRALAGESLRSIAAEWTTTYPPSSWTKTLVEKLVARDPAEVSDTEAALIAEANRRIDDGQTPGEIAADWVDRVVPIPGARWESTSVRNILCNPRNAALIEDGAGTIPAKWPAIITENQWRAVRSKLTDPKRSKSESNSLRWIGSTLYRCGMPGCDSDLRNAGSCRVGGQLVTVYRCRKAGHLSIPAAPVDEYVHATARDVLNRDRAALLRAKTPAVDRDALNAKAAALRARLDETADAYADGDIDKAEWLRVRDRITPKLDAISRQLAALISDSPLAGIADAPDPGAAYDAAGTERQRAIVADLMTVTILPGKRGRRAPGAPFDYGRVVIEPVERA